MTDPYYQDEFVTLYHGEALDVLDEFRNSAFHHCVTDPPYILQAGSSSQRGSKTGGWADMMNSAHWYSAWFRKVSALLKHEGSAWVFGNWRSLPVYQRAAIDAEITPASLRGWDKDWIGPGGPQQLRSQHETCLLLAKPGFKQPDRSQGDVLRIKASSSKPTGHPAEKPVALMRRVLELSGATAGDTILDPFAGSMTVALAAKQIGIKSVSIEYEERWCEVGARRLDQYALDFGGVQ